MNKHFVRPLIFLKFSFEFDASKTSTTSEIFVGKHLQTRVEGVYEEPIKRLLIRATCTVRESSCLKSIRPKDISFGIHSFICSFINGAACDVTGTHPPRGSVLQVWRHEVVVHVLQHFQHGARHRCVTRAHAQGLGCF